MSNYTIISPPSSTPSAPLVNTLSLLHYGRASIRRGKSDGYVGGGAETREKEGGGQQQKREKEKQRRGGGQKRGADIKKYKGDALGKMAKKRESAKFVLRRYVTATGRDSRFTRCPPSTHSPLSYPFLRGTGVTHYSHSHLGSLGAHTH